MTKMAESLKQHKANASELIEPEADEGIGKPSLTKADFDLHVLLIVHETGLAASKARFKAWLEGPDGLSKRLAK